MDIQVMDVVSIVYKLWFYDLWPGREGGEEEGSSKCTSCDYCVPKIPHKIMYLYMSMSILKLDLVEE